MDGLPNSPMDAGMFDFRFYVPVAAQNNISGINFKRNRGRSGDSDCDYKCDRVVEVFFLILGCGN